MTDQKKSNTLCPIPWIHMGVQTNGDLRQCCQMIKHPFGKFSNESNQPIKWSPSNSSDVRNHPIAKKVREEMLQGKKPSICDLCWKEEDVGITTKRQTMLSIYSMDDLVSNTTDDGTIDTSEIPIKYLDLRLGNLCNLKCRSCGPGDSSLWLSDHAEITQVNDKSVLDYYGTQKYDIVKRNGIWKVNSNDFDWANVNEFDAWINQCADNGLDRIYFTGGEPTVNKKHMDILDILIKKNKAKNTSLEYNTNLVALPQRLLDQWCQFKNVSIGISIDAKDDLAGYIRHPSIWQDIENNLDKIGWGQVPSLTAGISSTVSVLNVRHFISLAQWLYDKNYQSIWRFTGFHMLHGPDYLNVQCLPLNIKKQIEIEYQIWFDTCKENYGADIGSRIENQYSGIIRFMLQGDKSDQLPALKIATDKLDKIRNESMSSTIPWLWDIIKDL